MSKYLIILATIVVIFSCSTRKKTTTTVASPENYKNVLGNFEDQYPDYKSMSSDIRLNASLEGSSYSASGLVRHVRDEGIFISVKKIGFEIGQVLITHDSFFVLNRWEKEFIREPISMIEHEYQIKGEFAMIEELLTGIPQISSFKKNEKTVVDAGRHRVELSSRYQNIDLTLWLEAGNNLLSQAYYQDDRARGVRMKYGPTMINKVVKERELHTENIDDEVHIKLEYRNPEFDQTSLPLFNIPSHYTRRRM
jgi:hypothetical protein